MGWDCSGIPNPLIFGIFFPKKSQIKNQRPAFGEFEVKKILDLPKNSKMKKEQVAKKILKTVQNWNNPRKNISGAGAGIQLWVLRNFFKNFRSRKNLLKKQHKGTSTVVIFSLILNFSVFFTFFFIFGHFFHIWHFFGISRKSRDFSIPWDFFGIFIPDFLRKSHGIFFPWDWDFFSWDGKSHKKATSDPDHNW